MENEEDTRKSVVVVGGGTGTYTVLQGLKTYQKHIDLRAVVTMADSGGSTGRLRDEFGYLPVGDVRMALVALAREFDTQEALIRRLFLYRFDKGGGLSGHNFGNLLLVALTDILGSEEEAISVAARILRAEGHVIPVTTEKTHLIAVYDDGVVVKGENNIDEPLTERNGHRITKLSTHANVTINPRAEEALLSADLIVLGPGDLYTSVLANCVIDGVADAIRHSLGKVVYVSNLMTKAGQTTNMGTKEHQDEIARYINREPDVVLINNTPLPENLLENYKKEDEYPVVHNHAKRASHVIVGDFLAKEEVTTQSGDTLRRSLIRHDSRKLARALIDLL